MQQKYVDGTKKDENGNLIKQEDVSRHGALDLQ